ncbi:Uncharacterised protein [Cedecea neteri]|uniref:Uncharacterized protein n=1 Tax=Cedecea neteri TaxID=158822 RepID=A0A2X2T6D5_9ENTR|nr:Uncharacterised protein [Cedecea neteri]
MSIASVSPGWSVNSAESLLPPAAANLLTNVHPFGVGEFGHTFR